MSSLESKTSEILTDRFFEPVGLGELGVQLCDETRSGLVVQAIGVHDAGQWRRIFSSHGSTPPWQIDQ
jgi:hypothetical protein